MHNAFLNATLGVPDRVAAGLALAALEGDGDALCALHDRLEETGAPMTELLKVGENAFVHTVTYAYVGRVRSISHSEIVLDGPPSCVYDTGRFDEFLADGTIGTSALMRDPVSVGRATVVCATPWRHPLPTASVPAEE